MLARLKICILLLLLAAGPVMAAHDSIRFNRDIRPILTDNCYACHGPDKNQRKAKLRLDTKEGLFTAKETNAPVVPGKPGQSELYRRLTTHEADELMPKTKTGEPLPSAQIALVKRWIEQGAPWEGHWAYTPVVRPTIPGARQAGWTATPVDNFILARLKAAGLKPAPEASRRLLLRRLSFDLTGLPPTPAEVADFEADRSPDAWEHAVDRMLASPHYGERQAQFWLDGARYADTDGFHADNYRSVYPYRDYVIRAFNSNMPFDRFTREQLAGDLLPHPTSDQKAASTFNRLGRSTEEGGAQPKEFLAKYAADRVRTVSQVWLASTMGCCECHDHKFDPFTIKDFYSLEAYFADIKEQGVGARETSMVPTDEQAAKLKQLDAGIAAAKKKLDAAHPAMDKSFAEWEASLKPPRLVLGTWQMSAPMAASNFDAAFDTTNAIELAANPLTNGLWTAHPEFADGTNHTGLQATHSAVYLQRAIESQSARELKMFLGSDDAVKVWLNGTNVHSNKIKRATKPDEDQVLLSLRAGTNSLLLKIINDEADSGFYFQAGVPSNLVATLATTPTNRTREEKKALLHFYRTTTPEYAAAIAVVEAAKKERDAFAGTIPVTLATVSTEPRATRLLARGNWMDDSGEVLSPAPPGFLAAPAAAPHRLTRLDLANWITATNNPLTARVFVNRLWRQCFGSGICKTTDDFGTRGSWPSDPELLDWLASEFQSSGWDVKHMIKLMVMSGAYRQSSVAPEKTLRADPSNRLFSRQTAFRLDAEAVRDNALAVGGLLVDKIGGPSVKPYQPDGYWDQLNFPKRTYDPGHGDDLHRRGLYTFWCRTFLQPSLQAFDAPSREECTIERPNSNTPLQAMAMLNDPAYVEAARGLAGQIVAKGGAQASDKVAWAFDRALDRKPTPEEEKLVLNLYEQEHDRYTGDKAAAKELLGVGESPVPAATNPTELAAWTSVARAILNLHESITRF